jgi:hypothetical protein
MKRPNTLDTLLVVLPLAGAVFAVFGVLAGGGSFVEATTAGMSSLLLLGVGVVAVKLLWQGKVRGKAGVLVALIVLVVAIVAGLLKGGGEKIATTVMATPTPTLLPTVPSTPLAGEIEAQASSQAAASLWIDIIYGEDRTWRGVLKASGGERLVVDSDISANELKVVNTTLGITQSVAVVTNPAVALRYVQDSQHYVVRSLDGETNTYLGEVFISPLVQVETYRIPPIEITNGDVKKISEERVAHVIVHRVPAPAEIEVARDTWVVAGMILISQ